MTRDAGVQTGVPKMVIHTVVEGGRSAGGLTRVVANECLRARVMQYLAEGQAIYCYGNPEIGHTHRMVVLVGLESERAGGYVGPCGIKWDYLWRVDGEESLDRVIKWIKPWKPTGYYEMVPLVELRVLKEVCELLSGMANKYWVNGRKDTVGVTYDNCDDQVVAHPVTVVYRMLPGPCCRACSEPLVVIHPLRYIGVSGGGADPHREDSFVWSLFEPIENKCREVCGG